MQWQCPWIRVQGSIWWVLSGKKQRQLHTRCDVEACQMMQAELLSREMRTVMPPDLNTIESEPLPACWLLMRLISCFTKSMNACRSAVTPLLLASTVKALQMHSLHSAWSSIKTGRLPSQWTGAFQKGGHSQAAGKRIFQDARKKEL